MKYEFGGVDLLAGDIAINVCVTILHLEVLFGFLVQGFVH
jgi:hypothetical protein